MIYLILAVSTVVFFASLEGYKKIRSVTKSKLIEWILWVLFCMWLLGFAVLGMSFLKDNYPDLNRALAVAPIALGAILFLVLNRKMISVKGFNKEDTQP